MIGNVYIDKKRYLYSTKIKLDTVGSDATSRIDLLCGSVEFSDLQIRSRFYLYLDFPGKLMIRMMSTINLSKIRTLEALFLQKQNCQWKFCMFEPI